MSRVSVLVIALLAMLVASTMTATAAKRANVKTTSSLKYTPAPNEYDFAIFSGKVKAKKGCAADRKVTVSAKGGPKAGTVKTDSRGRFEVTAGSEAQPGRYVAKVKKTTLKNRGKTVSCRSGKSKLVNVS